MATITESELLEALLDATGPQPCPEDAYTSAELKQLTGWGIVKTREVIRHMVKTGKLEHVKVYRQTVNEIMWPSSAYRLIK